jgi:hypothetical protein
MRIARGKRYPICKKLSGPIVIIGSLSLACAYPIELSFGSETTTSDDIRSAFTSSDKTKLQQFLEHRFSNSGISKDLVRIIISRVDRYAHAKYREREKDINDLITEYPSVITQVKWQRELNKIATEYAGRHPLQSPRPQQDVVIEGEHLGYPKKDDLNYFIAQAIRNSQGELSDILAEKKIDSDGIYNLKSKLMKSIPRHKYPVTINKSKVVIVDQFVAEWFAKQKEIRSKLHISSEIKYVNIADASIIIPSSHYMVSAAESVVACLDNIDCNAMNLLAQPQARPSSSASEPNRANFLASLFLTLPYGPKYSGNGVIQVTEQGHYKGYCSLYDVQYNPSRSGETVDPNQISRCLNRNIQP